MPQRSIRYQKQFALLEGKTDPMPLTEAIDKVKAMAAVTSNRSYKGARKRKDPPQTVDLVFSLGIDPKQADQMLRGSISLPKSVGKTNRVIAFCDGPLVEAAKAAGAIEAGSDELVDKISKGWMDFDVAIAHPSLMGKVGKLGRVLGPQGKMPSPKTGSVTADVETAVREFSAGKLEYRNDAGGNIQLPVGKTNTSTDDLHQNIDAVIRHVIRIKPVSAKGHYIKKVCLSATHTPSVRIHLE